MEAASFRHPSPGTPPNSCSGDSAPGVSRVRGDSGGSGADREPFPCALSRFAALPQPAVQPCVVSNVRVPGCVPPRDTVQETLNTRGKAGQKISVARGKVLDILQNENACTDWYRTKDVDPAGTFRTLSFEVDGKGESSIVEIRSPGDLTVLHNPYVGRVIQGDGSYATITLNAHGAFFAPMANLEESPREGGILTFRGVHSLQVGPYAGNTLAAQVLTLLHEFGHLLELLPIDEGDHDGKSVRNSTEVLRYCRAQIESAARNKTLLSSR
jgi:hypothetical protein